MSVVQRTRKKAINAPSHRLSHKEISEIAYQIRECESAAREAISGIQAAEEVIRDVPKRVERTRAGEVSRLERAVTALCEGTNGTSAPGFIALSSLSHARSLRWRLALASQHVAIGEARKLASAMMPLEDLIQEGLIGIYRAALRFDPDRGIHFTTYAHWWARAQMTRSIETDGRHIRLPGGVVGLLRNLHAVQEAWVGNAPPTVDEYAALLDLSPQQVEVLLQLPQVLTFSDIINDDEEVLFDPVCDADQEEVAVITSAWRSLVEPALNDLEVRSRRVVRSIYEEDCSRSDVGKEIGLSRERVRQIEGSALAYLRAYTSPDHERNSESRGDSTGGK